MIARPSTSFVPTPRTLFRRRRAQAALKSGLVVVALGLVGALFLAPRELAAVRLLDVGLAWWAALAAHGLFLLLLAAGPPGDDARP